MGPSPTRASSGNHLRLEIRDLRMVMTVASEGSLTQAGAQLNVSQPALSRHLRNLETRLGAPLFVRTGARMVPTATGDLLLRHASEVLEQLARTERALQASSDEQRRVLRVGTECYTGYHWLPGVANRFAASHPSTEIEIAFEAAGDPLPALRDGRIDVALLTAPRTDKWLSVSRLFLDELVAVVAPRHPWAGRQFVSPADFANARLLLLSAPETSYVVNRFLTPAGVRPRFIADVQLVGAMAALVEAEYGVGAVPSWTVAADVRAGRLVPLRLGRRGTFRAWSAGVRKSQSRERWIQDFIIALSTHVAATGFRAARA